MFYGKGYTELITEVQREGGRDDEYSLKRRVFGRYTLLVNLCSQVAAEMSTGKETEKGKEVIFMCVKC